MSKSKKYKPTHRGLTPPPGKVSWSTFVQLPAIAVLDLHGQRVEYRKYLQGG